LWGDSCGCRFRHRIVILDSVPNRSGIIGSADVRRACSEPVGTCHRAGFLHFLADLNADDLLRLIAEQSSDFIAALDTDFRYRALNPAYVHKFQRIFGTRLDIGMSVPDALAHLPEERERVMAMFERALRGEEFTVVQPFGDHERDRGTYEVRFRPIHSEDGHLRGSFHVVRDVTVQRRAEAESELLKSTTLAIAEATRLEVAISIGWGGRMPG
jgi:PAS domain S-box-containing protein